MIGAAGGALWAASRTLLIHQAQGRMPMAEAFVLLESAKGRNAIRAYFDRYLPIAIKHSTGFILACIRKLNLMHHL